MPVAPINSQQNFAVQTAIVTTLHLLSHLILVPRIESADFVQKTSKRAEAREKSLAYVAFAGGSASRARGCEYARVMTNQFSIRGEVAPGFEFVRDLLADGVRARPNASSQLCIRVNGEVVVDLVTGDRLNHDSLTGVYSVSKAVAALTLARLLEEGRLSLDQPVAQLWPEFAAGGKDHITVGQLLSHQGGLPVINATVPPAEVLDSAPAAARLAAQTPLWVPGSAFGYHALTIGILIEELVRRVEGRELRESHEEHIRAPRDADFYLGLPESHEHRYVPLERAEPTPAQQAELDAQPQGDPLTERMFANVAVGEEFSDTGISTNNPAIRRAGLAALGGVGSARGLARLFADALPGAASPIASPETFAAMRQMRSWGLDRTLGMTNAFGAVFMLPQPRMPFGSLEAFGHDGAGGALAFADTGTGVAFGYIPVPIQPPGGADPVAVDIARRVRDHLL